MGQISLPRCPNPRLLAFAVKQQVNDVHHTTIETKAITDSVRSNIRADQIKSWLCYPDPSVNANHARTLRQEGTGTWLLGHETFQSWLSGLCRHLWLHGLAGCGKTVLSATVLDHLGKGSSRLVLSFFFDFSDRTKQTMDGMLRSLAFQLYQSEPGSAGLLDASFQAHRGGRDQPTTKTLEDVVVKMLAIQKKGYIVLDALDESTTRGELLLRMKNMAATYIGHQEIVQLLLDKGAAINAQGGKYTNAFQAASLQGNQAIIQLLLDNGAAINAQGGKYGNALQAASFRGHQEVVQLLLDKGADVNAQGGKFGKAITAASDRGHREIVRLLLDHEPKAI
ncbi:Protein fem-1 B [Beauveria bassiana D1-5]|uniref:Protein fem-1 B n=1 Tax=Beauveria bassiana D1-5 TaxID=1245745 RepID=A0A0A2VVW5_BEABA|nr:Protein fem-1 B [Beauveria bassiana D1-5]